MLHIVFWQLDLIFQLVLRLLLEQLVDTTILLVHVKVVIFALAIHGEAFYFLSECVTPILLEDRLDKTFLYTNLSCTICLTDMANNSVDLWKGSNHMSCATNKFRIIRSSIIFKVLFDI